MCWLGLWAVLGGARRGWTRRGAGVIKLLLSSCMYDDDRVGGEPAALSESPLCDLRCRGNGLPSPGSCSWRFAGKNPPRSGVYCGAFDGYELSGGEPVPGDRFGRCAELVSPSTSLDAWDIWLTLLGDPVAEEPLCPPRPPRTQFLAISSRTSGTIAHFIPFPGSSVIRAVLWKALFNERLWRIEFCSIISTARLVHIRIN